MKGSSINSNEIVASAKKNQQQPAAPSKIRTNEDALKESAQLQEETLQALVRARQQASEAETVGTGTLQRLHDQRNQLGHIQSENERLGDGLQQAEQLQNRLGRWALRFNTKRAARKQVERERRRTTELEEKRKEREANRAMELEQQAQAMKQEDSIKIVKHKKSRKKQAKKESATVEFPSKPLLEGVTVDDPYKTELDQLVTTDAVIDTHLDELGAQLETLLTLSKVTGTETKAQNAEITKIQLQVEDNQHQQSIVNKRNTRFLDGRIRKRAQMQDTLSPAALLRMAAKSN